MGTSSRTTSRRSSRLTSFHPRQIVAIIGGLSVTALVATAAIAVASARQNQLSAAGRELGQLSLTLSEEVARTMQSVDLMLADVQDRIASAHVGEDEQLRRFVTH